MSVAERYEQRVRFVLGLLEDKPNGFRRKEIKVKWILHLFPESMFNKVFDWLRTRGYIAKKDAEMYLSPYVITEAGKKHLNGLRA